MKRKSYKRRKYKVRDKARLCKFIFVMFMVTITYILMEISHNNISEAGNIVKENNDFIGNNRNIRILIKTNGHKGIVHDNIELVTNTETKTEGIKDCENGEKESGFSLKLDSDNIEQYKEGDIISIEANDISYDKGMIIKSISRDTDGIVYSGKIDIYVVKNGYVIINELPVEDYICKVLPSEMPSEYGIEPLKAQAVCARTYAYSHLNNAYYKDYNACMDDSSMFQVYNNRNLDDIDIRAVKETSGMVMEYDNELINALYYSTSSGYSATEAMVFGGEEKAYNINKSQTIDGDKKNFIESDCGWFRWKTSIDVKDMTDNINRYYDMGDINNITVSKRAEGGMVKEIEIEGTNKSVLIDKPNEIRRVLAPVNDDVIRQDDVKYSNMSMLPSAYFEIEKNDDSFIINGGGFGHGVGMSQSGAKKLAEHGYGFEEILCYYYKGINIEKY